MKMELMKKTFGVYKVDWVNTERPWDCPEAYTLHKSLEAYKKYADDYAMWSNKAGLKRPVSLWLSQSGLKPNSEPYLVNEDKGSYEYLQENLGYWIANSHTFNDAWCCGMKKKAERFATYKHKNQTRKDNKTPYIAHPIAVAEIIKQAGVTDEDFVASALLHDTVEDTDTTLEEICAEFGSEVAKYVCLLTRPRGDDRDAYHERIIYAAPTEVQIIKLADVLHSLRTLDEIANTKEKEKFRKNVTHALEKYYLPLAERISPQIYGLLKTETQKLTKNAGVAAFPDF